MNKKDVEPVTPFEDAVTHKSLELERALQDVARLREENVRLKLQIIDLRQLQTK